MSPLETFGFASTVRVMGQRAEPKLRVKKDAGRYHHGHLKEALLVAAERYIVKTGSIDLPLREVASSAGVSHTAAYRHFASKTALLAEVARRGFTTLTAQLSEAEARPVRKPEQRLIETGMAYVAFALEAPGSFRAMFDATLKPFTAHPGLAEAAFDALAVLNRVLRAGVAEGVFRPDDVSGSVMTTWATIHGQATLLADDQLAGPFEVTRAEGLASARLVMRRLFEGLRAA